MVRNNTRPNNRSNRRRRPRRGNARNVQRSIQHIAANTAVRKGLPNDPPSIALGVLISRTLMLYLLDTAATVDDPGSISTNPYSGRLIGAGTPFFNITLKMIHDAIFGTNGLISSTSYLYAIKSIAVWGPMDPGSNAAVTLSLSGDTDRTVSDSGTRMNRAKVKLSNPTLNWHSATDTGTYAVVRVGVNGQYQAPAAKPHLLATMHISYTLKSM